MTNNVYDSLYGKQIKLPGTDMCLSLEHAEKERMRVTFHWIPATYPVECIVEAVTGDNNAEVFRLRNQEGRWCAMCRHTMTSHTMFLLKCRGKKMNVPPPPGSTRIRWPLNLIGPATPSPSCLTRSDRVPQIFQLVADHVVSGKMSNQTDRAAARLSTQVC